MNSEDPRRMVSPASSVMPSPLRIPELNAVTSTQTNQYPARGFGCARLVVCPGVHQSEHHRHRSSSDESCPWVRHASMKAKPDMNTIATESEPVIVREVGLRDGLQSITRIVSTDHKIEWLNGAYAAGLREIGVGSFVPAWLLIQLVDTAEVLASAKQLPGLVTSVLVPNLRGAQAALDRDVDVMLLPMSASHAHGLA